MFPDSDKRKQSTQHKQQGVSEGDSQEPKGRMKSDGTRSHSTYGSRDNYKLGGPESSATPVKSKDFKKDALNIFNQRLKKKGVAEATKLPAQTRELKGKELDDYLDRIRNREKGKTDKYKLPYIQTITFRSEPL